MSIEGVGDGGGKRGMEGTARLGAKGDIRFERFPSTENISYPTRRTLWSMKMSFGTNMACGEWCGCAPRCPRCSRLRWKS